MMHPFVDGCLFTRAVGVKKGVGLIMLGPAPTERKLT